MRMKALAILGMVAVATGFASAQLPALKPTGTRFTDPSGKPVTLRGVNLGNWFLLEMWMMSMAEGPTGVRDQYTYELTLKERFGEAEKDRLMDAFRESWITDRDLKIIRSFNMNVVRLPLDYRMFESDEQPMRLRPNAWRWLDRALQMCEKNGLYVILDMHGAQGGQTENDHTGRSGQNKLWTVEDNQLRLEWLWSQIAARYRGRSVVLAYDALNEPYGGSKEQQLAVFRRLYKAIRRGDPQKLIFAHGNWDDFDHYGDPAKQGWFNVGFQMHYYPGVFGGSPTPLEHAKHLARMPEVAARLKKLNVPFIIGEMNVVFKGAGGAAMMRRHYDTYESFGWITTMWSYRATSKDGGHGDATWGMITNRKPARTVDIRTATKEQIEAFHRGYATEEIEIYEELRRMLTVPRPVLPPLPVVPKPVKSVPYQDKIAGWQAFEVGNALKGGLQNRGNNAFALYGGGGDIWGRQDAFRFLGREVTGDFTLEVTVDSLEDIEAYAKAGLMVRVDRTPESGAALLSLFPSGEAQFAFRAEAKGEMTGTQGVKLGWPVRIRLQRRGQTITAFSQKGKEWTRVAEQVWPNLPSKVWVGPVALSHDNGRLVRAEYRDLKLTLP